MGKTLIAAVAGMALATFLVWPGRREARLQPSQASVEPATFAPASRLVYPFSVIPGGVRSAAELRAALRADPVAARHYAGFDLRHVEVVRLEEAHAAYVSYRRHNRVLWTSKKVMLAKGEQLLSDGMNLARTRCGNRISFTPIPDLTSLTEPDETVWDTPEIPPVYSSVDVTEKLVEVPMTGSAARRKPTGVLPKDTDFPIPIVFLGGAKAVNTPEPGTWLMLLTGLAVFLIMKFVVKVPGWRNRQTQRT